MQLSFRNKFLRLIWNLVWVIMFRPFPTKIFNFWRLFLLRLFGAKVHKNSGVYASCKIWAPWNLELEENAWLGPSVNCYNPGKVKLEKNATVSQNTHLCSASHDITNSKTPLITAPIIIKSQSWIAADAFVGMGVTIGEGAVVGARSAVFKDVESWTVVGGNPIKFIKKREINE